MNILNFIIIDKPLRSTKYNLETNMFAMEGEVYIPLETPVPIIQKGVGCVGIGMVSELNITKSSTMIYFSSTKISESAEKAYYDLYRNQISTGNQNMYSNQEDVVIPGLARGMKTTTKSNRNNKPTHKSLMNYGDDDYHWD